MFGPDGEAALTQAVGDVAERSFFAIAEPCDGPRFAELADTVACWYTASVRFEEDGAAGVVECVLPHDLAGLLFDAFSGRDAADAPPDAPEVADLIGEFANMVCGAWLTRAANGQTFTLRAPQVLVIDGCSPPCAETALTMAINDRPVTIAVRIADADEAAEA